VPSGRGIYQVPERPWSRSGHGEGQVVPSGRGIYQVFPCPQWREREKAGLESTL